MAGEIENLDLDQYIVDNIYYSGASESDSENEEIVAKRGKVIFGCCNIFEFHYATMYSIKFIFRSCRYLYSGDCKLRKVHRLWQLCAFITQKVDFSREASLRDRTSHPFLCVRDHLFYGRRGGGQDGKNFYFLFISHFTSQQAVNF